MSFNGEGARPKPASWSLSCVRKFNLPAYYYAMTFKLEDERPGRGIDNYGAPIKRATNEASQVLEHAVLVGSSTTSTTPTPKPARSSQNA